MRNVKK